MGVDAFDLGVVGHPVVRGFRHAEDPALRRYRAAAGVGPHHACFRANTGAACSETSTSISNRRLRLSDSISSFYSGVRLSTALVEPLLRPITMFGRPRWSGPGRRSWYDFPALSLMIRGCCRRERGRPMTADRNQAGYTDASGAHGAGLVVMWVRRRTSGLLRACQVICVWGVFYK